MSTPTQTPKGKNSNDEEHTIGVLDAFVIGPLGARSMVQLASACPADSTDPVDKALRASAGTCATTPLSFESASPERRYSKATVMLNGEKYEVLRGDLTSILEVSQATKGNLVLVHRNARSEQARGRRCLGVAVSHDGEPYKLQGFISLGLGQKAAIFDATDQAVGSMARIRMWPVALRIQHWLNFFLILIMTFTGYYIMNPYYVTPATSDTGFFMGAIRFTHVLCGFLWLAVALWRISLFFVARTRHMQWRSLWPLYTTNDLSNLVGIVKHYLLIKSDHPVYLGHNPLQQITYTFFYGLSFVQIFTGLALMGVSDPSNWFWMVLSYPVHWVGIPVVRMTHAVIMYLIWMFAIAHVYLVIRADVLEESGATSSMFNGRHLIRRGTTPADGPKVQ